MSSDTVTFHHGISVLELEEVVAAISQQAFVQEAALRPQVHGALGHGKSGQDPPIGGKFREFDKTLGSSGLGRVYRRGLVYRQKSHRRP